MATVRTVDSVFPKRKKANSGSAAVDKSRCSLVLKKKSKDAGVFENHEELSTSTTGFFGVAAAAAAVLHRPAAALTASRSAGKDGDSHSNRAALFFLFFCLMHGCATTSVNVQSVVNFPSSRCGIFTAERFVFFAVVAIFCCCD